MKAAVVFTGTGPILILTSHAALDDPDLISRLAAKGIGKFIANEVPLEDVRRWYGPIFDRVMADATEDDELRIVDVDGKHIFCHLRLHDLGPAVRHDTVLETAGA